MIVDEIKIKVSGGKGGNGIVAFNKNKGEKGPTGGDGGNGGNVHLEGVSNLTALNKFRFKKEFPAGDGVDGKNKLLEGAKGKDIVLKVPIGTVAHNLDTGKNIEIVNVGEKTMIAKGGKRGRGNWHFRSSRNTTPRECEEGIEGQRFNFILELRMIADVGFIGLPSAGKSSLLNALTKAKAKTAAYHFTTLEPNLGDYYGLILADIPGLIEGASSGKGLGIKFLRHIKRTRVLIHCISCESENLVKDYKIIKEELRKYEVAIARKKEYIFLTKTDLVNKKEAKEKMKELKKISPDILAVSIYDKDSLEKVKKLLNGIKDKK
ncbi:MAG: Obg family GTPase CgtA [Candidatus Pacebacteria bacterium]|nr:Obg family GTPase CgtA [Candidatus Paceibacterota bacterium]